MAQVLGFLVYIAQQIIIAQVIGIAYQAIFGERNRANSNYANGSIKETARSTLAPLPIVYGRNFLGGNEVFIEAFEEDNKTLYVIQTISEGPIYGVARLNTNGTDATNLVSNGSCEASSNWTTLSGTAGRSSTHHDGSYGWYISSNSSIKSDNMSWTSGDLLEFSFWIYLTTDNLYGFKLYDADGTTILISTNLGYTTTAGWHNLKLSGYATKTGSSGRIEFSNENNQGVLYIDSVNLYNRPLSIYLDDTIYTSFNTDIVAFGAWEWGTYSGFTLNQKFAYDFYQGTSTQVYPEYIHALKAAYLDNMRYTAYIVFKFEYDPDLYNSLPSRTFLVDGMYLYDFRASHWYGDPRNGVLALYNYMTSTRYGLGFSSDKFDITSWTSAATYIDTKGWHFDYVVTDGQAGDIIDTILKHIRCELVEYAGVFYLYYFDINLEATAMTLVDNDILQDETGKSAISIAETDINEFPDGYKVSFTDITKLGVTDSIYIGDTQGYIKNLDLYGCSSRALAFELGSYYFERDLLNRHITGTFRDKCQRLQKHDLVSLTSTVLGVTSALLRVVSVSIRPDGCVDLDLIYESTDLYNKTFDSDVDEVYETTVPRRYDVPGVVSASGAWTVIATASYSGVISVTWTNASYVYAVNVWISTDNVTYKLYASTILTKTFNISALGSYYDFGDTVYIKLQSVTKAGVKSAMPADPQMTITVNGPLKWAGFYVGQYDLWGGNVSINHADTKVVLGGLDGTPKLALGASADLMTLTNVANYAGFYADGTGSFRHGSNNAYGIFDVAAGTYVFHGVIISSDCSVVVSGTTVDTFTINSDANDATVNLVFGRTTGGNASISWNGTAFSANKTFGTTGNLVVGGGYVGTSLDSDLIQMSNNQVLVSGALRLQLDANNHATFTVGSSGVVYNATANIFSLAANVQHQTDTYAKATTGWRVSYTGEAEFRTLNVDEIHAKAFIADIEQALAGGQIITKSVAKMANNFALPSANASANMDVEEFDGFTGQVFANGDIVQLRQISRNATGLTIGSAWGTVSYVSRNTVVNPYTQRYTFTRSAGANAGTANGNIAKATLALDYGTANGGFYEVSAYEGNSSPYVAIKAWNTHPATGLYMMTEMGRLKDSYGYTDANIYGFASGKYANNSSFLTIDDVNGIRLQYKNAGGIDAVTSQWYMNGTIVLGTVGGAHANITPTETIYYVGSNTVAQFGANVSLFGGMIKLYHNNGAVGMSVESNNIYICYNYSSGDYTRIGSDSYVLYKNNVLRLSANAGGVTIYGDNNSNNYVSIGSNNIRLMSNGQNRLYVDGNQIDLTSDDTWNNYLGVSASGIRMYQNGTPRVIINSNGSGYMGNINHLSWDDGGNVYVGGTMYCNNFGGSANGTLVLISSNTQRNYQSTNGTWFPVKGIQIGVGGTYRISFWMITQGYQQANLSMNYYNTQAIIKRNRSGSNSNVGTLRQVNSGSNNNTYNYATYTEEISGWLTGDIIEVWSNAYGTTNYSGGIANFVLYVGNPVEARATTV
jgi:hypothetical protein